MDVKIVPIDAFDPQTDDASKWIWGNAWGDGGAVVVFHDLVVHTCAKAGDSETLSVGEIQDCPNGCGVRFYPRAWEKTRDVHRI